MKMIVAVVFFFAFLVAGVLGPGTAMLFVWPAVLAVAVVGVAGILQIRERFTYRPSVLALWAVTVFLSYVGWRAAGSDVEYLARPDLYLVAGCFLCFVGGAVLCEGTVSRKVLVYAWAVLVVGNVVMGCYQFFGDPKISVLSPLGFYRVIEDRQAGGFFNLGNHLAGFLELAVFPALGVALFGRVKPFARLMLALVVVAGLLGVVLSTSRGGAVATVVGLGVFVLLVLVITAGRLGWKKLKVGLAIGALGVLVLGGVGIFGKQVFSESFEGGMTEQKGFRFSAWEMALEQNALAPVLGTGARTYEVYSRKFMPDSITFLGNHAGLDAEFTHNDYLQLLAEYGLVGLVLLVVAMVAVAWSAVGYLWWFRKKVYAETGRSSSTRLGVVLGACGGLAALAAHSVLDFNMHVSANALVAATLVGFLANPGIKREEGVDARGKGLFGRPMLVLMAAICGGWVLWTGVPKFRAEILIRQGQTMAREKRFLPAVGAYEEALVLDPKNYLANHYRGAAFVMLGDDAPIKPLARGYYTHAVEEFDRGRSLHPHDLYLLLSLGDVLSELEAEENAEEVYREAIEWAPNHRRVWQRYGGHLLKAGKLEEAKAALERALELEWYGSEPAQVRRWLKLIDAQLAKQAGE